MTSSANETFTIVLAPFFELNLPNYETGKYIHYSDLLPDARKEVLSYFMSNTFITDQVQGYALKAIRSNDLIAGPLYTGSTYDAIVTAIKFYSRNCSNMGNNQSPIDEYNVSECYDLLIYIDIILVHTPITYIQSRNNDNYVTENRRGVTIGDVAAFAQEGFSRVSKDGPLVVKFGRYLGDDPYRYNIYFEYERVSVLKPLSR